MSFAELSRDEIESKAGTRHAVTGLTYPAEGLQPYYEWLVRALHLLAESSAGSLRVGPEAGAEAVVRVAPGRATIGGVAVAYEGGLVKLAEMNNDVALVWLEDGGGGAGVVQAAPSSAGWPGGGHIKLAEVTLEAGKIAAVLDRRFEAVFQG